jgi:sugar phosphate isomerase/epimerase
MTVLSHGTDLSLAPTLGPLVRDAGLGVREAIEQVASSGFSAVQLDAALAGIRPRELDERARRDLVALLRRRDLRLAGWDLFIPRRHYVEPDLLDRAMQATLATIELAADTGRVPVSLQLPIDKVDADARRLLVEHADARAVRLAIHAEDQVPAMQAWLAEADVPALGVSIDPAAAIGVKADPAELVHRFARRLTTARLSDAPAVGERCPVGQGELDVADYRVAVDLAAGRQGPVVLDLRGLSSPLAAAAAARRTWERASFPV